MDIDRAALMEAFLADSREGLGAMEQALIALEARPDDRSTARQAIFRAAHTLKGNASTMGLEGLPSSPTSWKICWMPCAAGVGWRSIVDPSACAGGGRRRCGRCWPTCGGPSGSSAAHATVLAELAARLCAREGGPRSAAGEAPAPVPARC